MKVKTADLTGAALDWAVALAAGMNPRTTRGFGTGRSFTSVWTVGPFEPSTSWAQGGPLKEANKIITAPICGQWCAFHPQGKAYECGALNYNYIDVNDEQADAVGETELEAMCRAIAWGKFGDEVEVPDELCEVPASEDAIEIPDCLRRNND